MAAQKEGVTRGKRHLGPARRPQQDGGWGRLAGCRRCWHAAVARVAQSVERKTLSSSTPARGVSHLVVVGWSPTLGADDVKSPACTHIHAAAASTFCCSGVGTVAATALRMSQAGMCCHCSNQQPPSAAVLCVARVLRAPADGAVSCLGFCLQSHTCLTVCQLCLTCCCCCRCC